MEHGLVKKAQDEITRLRAENEDLRKMVVMGFYEEEMPMFQQGMDPPHELIDPVTAKECEGYIETIKNLSDLNTELVEELKRHLKFDDSRDEIAARELLKKIEG